MRNILYIVAGILIFAWAIGVFGYNTTKYIHILLVIAVVVIIIRLFQGRNLN